MEFQLILKGKPSGLLDVTNPDWVPSVKLGHSKYKVDINQAIDRYARVRQRKPFAEKKIDSSSTADNFNNELATNSLSDAEDELQCDCSTPDFQSFLVFMIRLRLNLLFQDIAYRFAIGKSTVAWIFHSWLDGAFLSMDPHNDLAREECPKTEHSD